MLKRWVALTRKNWLFAGSERSVERAAAIMTLVQSTKLNEHDPYAYLKDVLTRLLTFPTSCYHITVCPNRSDFRMLIR